jgi:FtsH-binding integral membrane protein
MQYEMERPFAAQATQEARAAFIRRVYGHLAGSVLAFVALEWFLLKTVTPEAIFSVFGSSRLSLLAVFLAFWAASWIAQVWARSETSVGLQYAGLALYIVAEAVIFLPLLFIATSVLHDNTLIPKAGVLTMAVFGGLTMSVFVTRKDYSFLGPVLCVGGWIAFGVIVAALLVPGGFTLGLFFSFAMVALISGYILYETSAVLLHMRTDQHVAAALMLFSSVATLFWWILRILMAFSDRN